MPAANASRKDIHEHSQVDKLFQKSNIGDITHPQLIWTDNLQMLHQIRITRKGMGTVSGRDASFGFPMGLEPQFSHEAFHAFMIDGPSLPLQLLGDAPIAI